jgi:uncharacterized membrane protein YkvA (DUF1232 family)
MTSATENPSQNDERVDLFARLVELIKTWLLDFEINAQLFVEIMNDELLPLSARALAVGVLLYLRAPRDIISENVKVLKLIGLVDDVIVMIIGLSVIVPQMPEPRLAYYKKKYKAVTRISGYEEILKSALGLLWERLVRFVENLRQRKYKETSAEDVAQSPDLREDLFDETMIFVADLNLDPATLDNELLLLPTPEKVVGLLASGLAEDQERVEQGSKDDDAHSALGRLLRAGKGSTD